MVMLSFRFVCALVCMLAALLLPCQQAVSAEGDYTPPIAPASPDAARAMEAFRLPEGVRGALAAAEPQIANPVAFTVTASGDVYVCETFRQQKGVEDNRGHMNWLMQDLQLESIEERVAMFRRFIGPDASAWEVEHDRIRLLRDTDGDGVFDSDTVFADGFSHLEEGTGAGVLEHDGSIYYTCIPKLWKLVDDDGDGVADGRDPLHHGYGVRVAFRGHDLHGLTVGPDGRIYFSIGDRGYNVITREGSRLKRPDTGAVFRCFPDGSHLEVFAYGLRNPQELAFDDAGNLFTGDNNSDSGDQARWVYVVKDGDTGWRMFFQYLDDRGPWNRERMWYPYRADEETRAVQPAYILPPIVHLGNGPSGLAYYPGTGLPARYDHHFFLVDFRGAAANSGIWSFAIEPKGASFGITDQHEFLWSILATDLAFAPDGSLLVSDWVNGWDGEGKGRLYRFLHEAAEESATSEVAALLTAPLEDLTDDALATLLSSKDQRVRQRAQFALVNRGAGTTLLARVSTDHDAAARHGLWGLWQMALASPEAAIEITGSLYDLLLAGQLTADMEGEVLKVLTDVWEHHGVEQLPDVQRQLLGPACAIRLQSESMRVAGFAAVATGLFGRAEAADDLLAFFNRLANTDPVARHQGVMGLVHLARRHPGLLARLAGDDGSAARLGVALAMRRLHVPAIVSLLDDADSGIVTEVARAINDEAIEEAMPRLADLIDRVGLEPAALRRVMNAAYRRGSTRDAEGVAIIAASTSMPMPIRVVAATMLRTWNAPEPLDTVDGRWRPLPRREVDGLREVVMPHLPSMLAGSAALRDAALETAISLEVKDLVPNLTVLFDDPSQDVSLRIAAFQGLVALADDPAPLIRQGLSEPVEAMQLAAVEAMAVREPLESVPTLETLLASESVPALQTSLRLISEITAKNGGRQNGGEPVAVPMRLPKPRAEKLLLAVFRRQAAGELPASALLDLLEAASAVNTPGLRERVTAFRDEQAAAAETAKDALVAWQDCLEGGDAEKGQALFMAGSAASCRRCHRVAGVGGQVGPQLTGIARERDRAYLLESIVAPNAKIAKGFETAVILTADGLVVSGIVREETEDYITLITPDGEIKTIATDDVDDRSTGQSGMPADLTKNLSRREIRDLVAFLSTLTDPPSQGHE
jgi:quinoprotein glucose dehydrogenase